MVKSFQYSFNVTFTQREREKKVEICYFFFNKNPPLGQKDARIEKHINPSSSVLVIEKLILQKKGKEHCQFLLMHLKCTND